MTAEERQEEQAMVIVADEFYGGQIEKVQDILNLGGRPAGTMIRTIEAVRKGIALGEKQERERCAKVAEQHIEPDGPAGSLYAWNKAAMDITKAIREGK